MKLTTRKDILEHEAEALPQLPPHTYEVVAQSASRYPDRKALKFFLQGDKYQKSVEWTYHALLGEITATANMFRDLGINDTDVVSYILPNTPETLFTVFGGETAGIVNAINPLLKAEQMVEIMQAAETKVLVTLGPFPQTDIWQKVSAVLTQVPSLRTVLTIDLGKYLGLVPKTLVALTTPKIKVNKGVRQLDFRKTLRKYPKTHLNFQRTIHPDDIASYFHTGGTTGKPKIAQHTHKNEIFNAWTLSRWVELEGFKTFFCGLPWFHVNGLMVTGMTPLLTGNCILMASPSGYRGKGVIPNFWKIVDHYKVSFFSSVPTALQMLLEAPQKGEDLSSLEYAICGAAPLSVKLFHDFERKTGVKIIEGYGFTEGTCVNSANPIHGQRKIGSIGLALPHHHMKIGVLDEQTGAYVRDAEVDEIGHIVCRGINIFPGYKEAIHNEKIWIHDGEHSWYNTGDLGRKDADAYFWMTGRKKELIIRGGHNIDPKSIEEPLAKHPAVAAVAAIGRPDKRLGEVPVAFVQLKPQQTATKASLMQFAQEHIAERAAIPKDIKIISELPLTAVGKVFKPDLIKREVQEVFTEELARIEELELIEIEVAQVSKKGLVAHIQIKNPDTYAASVDAVLGNYTIQYELT